jgi:hypothetical protein
MGGPSTALIIRWLRRARVLVSHAMTLRVADCQAAYEALRFRGAAFLTQPYDWGPEIRCFLQDPDGQAVEISESKAD